MEIAETFYLETLWECARSIHLSLPFKQLQLNYINNQKKQKKKN